MIISIEFYEKYSLTDIISEVTALATSEGYKMRKNPTLKAYSEVKYHGIIMVYMVIDKVNRIVGLRINQGFEPTVWHTQCDVGWHKVVLFNLKSESNDFDFPGFTLDVSNLSEVMKKALLMSTLKGTVFASELCGKTNYNKAMTLHHPSSTFGQVPSQQQLTDFEHVMIFNGFNSKMLAEGIYAEKSTGHFNVSAYAIQKDSLHEILGCTTDMLKKSLGCENNIALRSKSLISNLIEAKRSSTNDSVLISGSFIPMYMLEEATDTHAALLLRMFQKLPTTTKVSFPLKVYNHATEGFWGFTHTVTIPGGYCMYAIKYNKEVRKITVKLDPEKITISDEVLN